VTPTSPSPAIAGTTATAGTAAAPPARTERIPRRRRLWLLGAGAVAIGLAVAAFLLLGGGSPTALEAERVTVDAIPAGGTPVGLAVAADTPFVVTGTTRAGAVRPIEDAKPGPPIDLDDPPYSIAATATDLWVVTGGGLARVDAKTRQALGGPIDLDTFSGSEIAFGEGALWLTDQIGKTVTRVDPRTSRPVGDPIEASADVDGDLAAGEGAVWVLGADVVADMVEVTPVAPATDRALPPIRVGEYAPRGGIAIGAGAVWVADNEAERVRRIDPRTRRLDTRSIAFEGGVGDLAFGSGVLWVLDDDGGTVQRIDPTTLERVGQPIAVAAGGEARIVVAAGNAWVLSPSRRAVLRLSWS
jgi:streptogramin lyase